MPKKFSLPKRDKEYKVAAVPIFEKPVLNLNYRFSNIIKIICKIFYPFKVAQIYDWYKEKKIK